MAKQLELFEFISLTRERRFYFRLVEAIEYLEEIISRSIPAVSTEKFELEVKTLLMQLDNILKTKAFGENADFIIYKLETLAMSDKISSTTREIILTKIKEAKDTMTRLVAITQATKSDYEKTANIPGTDLVHDVNRLGGGPVRLKFEENKK